MDDSKPSRTAMVVALIRAEHARSSPAPLLRDEWAQRLIPPDLVADLPPVLQADAAVEDWLAESGLRTNVILRARYCEDQLRAAVETGVEQYVIVGAEFDSFAWRRPTWAQALRIYEIDHPATQSVKIGQLRAAGADLTQARFVAADLSKVAIDAALATTDYDPTRRTFFAWLGVVRYLTREANAAALAAMARASRSGSLVLLSYAEPGADGGAESRERQERSAAVLAAWGEPWVSAFTRTEMTAIVGEAGFAVRSDLSIKEIVALYRDEGAAALGRPRNARLLLAERI